MQIKKEKNITAEDLFQASIIWEFLRLNESLEKSDIIFVLCSHDIRVADYAAQLYHANYGSVILFSGGLNFFTKNIFKDSEASAFAARAIELGVPKESIIIEDKSTNTGENIHFTKKVLSSLNIQPKTIIAVQKPSMTLRVKLALDKQWSEVKKLIMSPSYDLEQANNSHINLFGIINEIVGDFQRIIEYPKFGFQAEVSIPNPAIEAFQYLKNNGYNLHLI